jgi:hypothetical protein
VLRLRDDGSAPPDNPFIAQAGAKPEIYSYGHRNIQGMAYDAATARVWANEHGSRGGDELNVIAAGNNYGWPEVTYSMEYWGPAISEQTQRPDVTDPVVVWTPSKAPSGLAVYTGTRVPGLARRPLQRCAQVHTMRPRAPSRDGIGKVYMGREISQVMGHRGARWLERSSRLREERPDAGHRGDGARRRDAEVADIGAGTGYFTVRLAERVPEGRVFAVDIQPEMLDILRQRLAREGRHRQRRAVLGREDDPRLPSNSIDAALLVDAYHEFAYPREMMQGIVAALRPGGRVFSSSTAARTRASRSSRCTR